MRRAVKPNGNILVFGTYHSIDLLGFVLGHLLDRRILNSIIWFKPNAQPNITARMLAESTEQIIWAVNETPKRAKKWTFNYWDAKEMNGGRQMRNLWEFPVTSRKERVNGAQPSQNPPALISQICSPGSPSTLRARNHADPGARRHVHFQSEFEDLLPYPFFYRFA